MCNGRLNHAVQLVLEQVVCLGDVGLGYTIKITLQFLTAKTHEVVCTSTAEGQGSTETDDIRIAINRALDEVFPSK